MLNSARDFLTITAQTSNSQGAALEIQPFCRICQQQSKCGSLNTSAPSLSLELWILI